MYSKKKLIVLQKIDKRCAYINITHNQQCAILKNASLIYLYKFIFFFKPMQYNVLAPMHYQICFNDAPMEHPSNEYRCPDLH